MRPHYGWVVLGVTTAVLALSAGTRFSFGAVMPAIVADRGWSMAAVAGASAAASIVIALVQPFVGLFTDRVGPRTVLAAGMVFLGAGALATAFARAPWQLYLAFGVLAGIGFGASLQLTGGILAARWFRRGRATAVATVQSGVAIASFVVVPVAMWLSLRLGWSGYYAVTAVVALGGFLPATLLLVRDAPPGWAAARRVGGTASPPAMAPALRSPVFWQLGTGMLA